MSVVPSGAYVLVRFDGSPVPTCDAQALGLHPTLSDDCLLQGMDAIEPGAIQVRSTADSAILLLGHLDEVSDLAARLGVDKGMPPLDLAIAACDRFGDELPREMLGAWVFIRWDRLTRQLIVAKSINQTYQLYVARRGDRIALAPELASLARLDWVDDSIDEGALYRVLASARVAMPLSAPTMLRHVSILRGGHVARFDRTGDRIIAVDPRLPITPWHGSFDDALAAAEAMLRDIVGGVVRRSTRIGVTLSGGLDSSLLAWIAAGECRPGETLTLLTGAAPPVYGLADDVPLATMVADHLQERLTPVVASLEASPYRPTVTEMRASDRPTMAPVLFSSSALAHQAAALGTSHLLYGSMGELTVTASATMVSPLRRLRRIAGIVRRRFLRRDLREYWPEAAFVPWLSSRLLGQIPDGWIQERRLPTFDWPLRRPGETWGYSSELDISLAPSIWDPVPGVVRGVSPFMDVRLLRLFAGMPVAFACEGGVHRAMARQMLKGHLPDAVRLQPKMPPSAGYVERLRDHAAAAKARLPLFRRAGIGEWLDLDRVERGLDSARAFDRAHVDTVFRTQIGVQAAEYFLWWLSGRPDEDNRI